MAHEVQIGTFQSRRRASAVSDRRTLRDRERTARDGHGGRIAEITKSLGMPYIFKSSFDKANRTSITSFRGPGLEKGLAVLKPRSRISWAFLSLTDVHTEEQAAEAGKIVDILQIPAFLCRQTDLAHRGGKDRQSRQREEGPVSFAVGNGQRGEKSRGVRKPAHYADRTRILVRL